MSSTDPGPAVAADLIAAVLRETPRMKNGEVTLAYGDACDCSETCCGFIDRQGDPTPIAARQAAAVLREAIAWQRRQRITGRPSSLHNLIAEIEAAR